jgi:AcrR family transcriptional regulator
LQWLNILSSSSMGFRRSRMRRRLSIRAGTPPMENLTRTREVGRPRVFSDEIIFRATRLVLERGGYAELTLEAIASEVGCTRQALVRRFGSKQDLLLAYLDSTLVQMEANYRIVNAECASPLAALRARFVAPPAERLEINEDRTVQANVLAFMLISSNDPEVSIRFNALHQIFLDEMERLIQASLDRGELRGVNADALARVLFSASLGETVRWSSTPGDDTLVSRLAEIFDLVTTPYRTTA